jgi:hypothetical protein
MLLASPALAAETTSADAALQKARRDLAAKLEPQLKSLSTRATRSARAMAADAPAPFAADRRSLAEEDGYIMCDIMNAAMQCGMKNTQATCEANTDCVWLADEEECNLSDEVGNEIGTELQAGVVLLLGPMMICSFSDPTDCPADTCVVYGDTCSVSDAAVDSAFDDASIAEIMKISIKCGAHQSENSCEANPECAWSMPDDADDDEPEESCGTSDDTNQLVVAEYCEIDPGTGSFSPASPAPSASSPAPSASGAVTAETALLGASLAAGLAALA